MKVLKTIDLTKEGEPKYTTYFYNKNIQEVYQVISNGYSCAISLMDECGLGRAFKFGSCLPKYILNDLK